MRYIKLSSSKPVFNDREMTDKSGVVPIGQSCMAYPNVLTTHGMVISSKWADVIVLDGEFAGKWTYAYLPDHTPITPLELLAEAAE